MGYIDYCHVDAVREQFLSVSKYACIYINTYITLRNFEISKPSGYAWSLINHTKKNQNVIDILH